MKWKWTICMALALALMLAMPALAANGACKKSVDEAKMYADQAAASAAKADMAVRNAEMAAADAKTLADKAGAAADRARETMAVSGLMQNDKVKMAAMVPKQIMGKATKVQGDYSYPAKQSLANAATQRYFDQCAMYPAALPTTQSLTGQCPIVAVAAGCESPNIAVCGTADRANKVATPLLTFKTTSALENSKIEALQPDQARSAACAILSTA